MLPQTPVQVVKGLDRMMIDLDDHVAGLDAGLRGRARVLDGSHEHSHCVRDFELTGELREAIHQACLLRFRPIMMTTMAALLGAVPLAVGTGVGSELRRPLGIAIVGGLLVSQMLTLYTTPVVYLYMDRLQLWLSRLRAGRRRLRPGTAFDVARP